MGKNNDFNENDDVEDVWDVNNLDSAKIGAASQDEDEESWDDDFSGSENISTEEIDEDLTSWGDDFDAVDKIDESNGKADVINISSGSSEEVVMIEDRKPKSKKFNDDGTIANDQPSSKNLKATHSKNYSDETWHLAEEHDKKEDGLAKMKKLTIMHSSVHTIATQQICVLNVVRTRIVRKNVSW